MKNIISLIDTNVIINFITKRDDPYKDACFEVMRLCAENAFKGYVTFHSLSIIWYVVRKQETEEKARAWLNNICEILTVTGATQEQVKEAIKYTKEQVVDVYHIKETRKGIHLSIPGLGIIYGSNSSAKLFS